MKVKELINELEKLPKEMDISIQSFDRRYTKFEVCWDITMEEFNDGYTDEPYIYLEKYIGLP